jgi:hypothetical protein
VTNPHDYAGQTQPEGWYPDPSGGPGTRWWDGRQWTQHVSDPALQVYASNEPRRVDPSTPLYTPWIWLIVLLPLVSLVGLMFWDMDAYMRSSMSSTDPFAQYTDPGYVLLQASSWLLYALSVLFAFLDRRVLLRRGFDRPFHWAWTFLGSTVYIIGRSVIVRRRSGKGLLPIWVTIGVIVISLIVGIAKVASAVSAMMSVMPSFR